MSRPRYVSSHHGAVVQGITGYMTLSEEPAAALLTAFFSKIQWVAGLASLTVFPVVHCSDAWGFVMKHTDGWSVCYSGDTRPCSEVRRAAQDCTVLIHEATFSPSLIEQVKNRSR